MYQILYPEPKGHKQIQGKSKTEGYKGEVNKGGTDDPGPDSHTFGDTPTHLESPFLKIVQYPIKYIHDIKLGFSIELV